MQTSMATSSHLVMCQTSHASELRLSAGRSLICASLSPPRTRSSYRVRDSVPTPSPCTPACSW